MTPDDFLDQLFERPGSIAVTPAALAQATGISVADAEWHLDSVAALTRKTYATCGQCKESLEGTGKTDVCPHCNVSFDDVRPVTATFYELRREPPRDVAWLLVVHGMNTRGEWQEELNWLVGTTYRHSIPIAIYKYGNIRQGVMFRFRQRMLMRKLIAEIRKFSADTSGVPDVIAHSFGTWLIAHALQSDSTLRVGRIILLGSIVRPDFPWATLSGQFDAVLNHGGTDDEWVPLARYFIPDSGPGATQGYAPPVINIPARGFRHSDYFASRERLRQVFNRVWRPFLSWETPPWKA